MSFISRKPYLQFLAAVVWLVVLISSPGWAAESPEWKAGTAAVDITPEEPMWMAGYASRTKPAEGTASLLHAKALVVQDAAGTQWVVVTTDLIGIPRILRENLTRQLSEKHQIPAAAVLINASHTHCGPELRIAAAPVDEKQEERSRVAGRYQEVLLKKLVTVVDQALENLAPAQLAYTHARCGVSMNRRFPTEEGNIINHPYPDGPVDQSVPVLKVSDAQGKPFAILFGYACHNTTLSFYEWCGDYAGFAQQALEADHPGVNAMFLMGCGGDQNPYPRGNIDLARQHGRALANSVNAALSSKGTRPVHGPLRVAYEEVPLTYATPPGREELTARLDSRDKYAAEHAKLLLKQLEETGRLAASYPYPVQVIRFGQDLAIIALAGETVVDYSLRLKNDLKGPAIWVAGYSNDVFAYIPSQRLLTEGGYEAGDAMKYFRSVLHPGPFDHTIEESIMEKVRELMEKTGPQRRSGEQ